MNSHVVLELEGRHVSCLGKVNKGNGLLHPGDESDMQEVPTATCLDATNLETFED